MDSFYDKLGEKRLNQLLDISYDKIFESDKIKHLFQNTPKEEIKLKQKLFLTQFLGGEPLYNQRFGPSQMRKRHLPHQITEEAKEEWLRCMRESIATLDWDKHLKEILYNVFPRVAQHMLNS